MKRQNKITFPEIQKNQPDSDTTMILKLPDGEFKITMMNMFKVLKDRNRDHAR